MGPEFEKELLEAIEKALAGIMVKPSWVLKFIKPVIERHLSLLTGATQNQKENA